MTDQVLDRLCNCHPRVKFGDLRPREIVHSDPQKLFSLCRSYPFAAKPEPRNLGTYCYRGYIAKFELTENGQLILRSYLYPSPPHRRNPKQTVVNELLHGNFWMVMSTWPRGPQAYVPFHDGVIVEDSDRWGVEHGRALNAVRYPERYEWYVSDMSGIFVGTVGDVRVDKCNDEDIVIRCGDSFPDIYRRVEFIRNERVICERRIVWHNGGEFAVAIPETVKILLGDQILATGKAARRRLPEGSPR